MNLIVSSKSSLDPQSFSASVAPWGQCCVRASLYRWQNYKACSGVRIDLYIGQQGFVGLSHVGS